MRSKLDLTIINQRKELEFDIFRKLTTADHTVHNNPCHRFEHKTAGMNYLVNRMETYFIPPPPQKKRLIVETVLNNNNCEQNSL